MKDYRILDFALTGIIYLLAYVCALVEVHERPIPGIRIRVSSTAVVWGLDPSIDNKKLAEEVPLWLLWTLGVAFPIGINLIVNFVLPIFCQVRVIAHDTRDFLLSLSQSVAIAQLFTHFTKNITGRFRPSFYDMCKWDYEIIWDGITNLCTDAKGDKEGRRSFPSGHASFAWATMLTLSLYLLGRFRLNAPHNCDSKLLDGRKTFLMSLCCLPLLLAVWICVTRTKDNWHHYSDILGGSVIGVGAANFAFKTNYGSVFSRDVAGLPIETIHDLKRIVAAILSGIKPRSEVLREYRVLAFSYIVVIYLLALVIAASEENEQPVPGIKVFLNSTTEVWSLDRSLYHEKLPKHAVPLRALMTFGLSLPNGINLVVNFVLLRFCQVRVIAHDTRDFLLSFLQAIPLAEFSPSSP
ncbi:hypothetical protein L914_16905 [Phytophthora nicotianae]|uniref:Phosphatidic acid phosphatase type 2/haloperoxidase domain-containing protein n=1 Tax=Phytophthora nicotianae TaxID=4792 RepID=W2MJ72_PHYNI|nr:hypothetical protein L914_16905 [Phytophthora nicotianae]